eukprot:CAMPEP_0171261364 /NCGR_PEP_ID=MMETSP0790-20130122/55953_1 /TAXON_ID=2925 /ORGANISM="Alexandrium catenella, Strain OF101" /LENGTH=92 /DNA_ID=CAMNT_0011729763 /DNA_START=20 /DNA_END=297 /DNA_ORIENTATION=+
MTERHPMYQEGAEAKTGISACHRVYGQTICEGARAQWHCVAKGALPSHAEQRLALWALPREVPIRASPAPSSGNRQGNDAAEHEAEDGVELR